MNLRDLNVFKLIKTIVFILFILAGWAVAKAEGTDVVSCIFWFFWLAFILIYWINIVEKWFDSGFFMAIDSNDDWVGVLLPINATAVILYITFWKDVPQGYLLSDFAFDLYCHLYVLCIVEVFFWFLVLKQIVDAIAKRIRKKA